jgi:hypothetical protein
MVSLITAVLGVKAAQTYNETSDQPDPDNTKK